LRTTTIPATVLLIAGLALTGCSDEGSSGNADTSPSPSASASESPTESPSESHSESTSESAMASPTEEAGTTVDITFQGGKVTPNGDRVKAKLGEPVTLKITADEGGEIHVHSTPEQEIEYPAGSSTEKLTIDKPGIVDVESHDLDQVIVQLQVS
jgi:hypothetical protein